MVGSRQCGLRTAISSDPLTSPRPKPAPRSATWCPPGGSAGAAPESGCRANLAALTHGIEDEAGHRIGALRECSRPRRARQTASLGLVSRQWLDLRRRLLIEATP